MRPSGSNPETSSQNAIGSGTARISRNMSGIDVLGLVGKASDGIAQALVSWNNPADSTYENPKAFCGSGSNMSPEPPFRPLLYEEREAIGAPGS